MSKDPLIIVTYLDAAVEKKAQALQLLDVPQHVIPRPPTVQCRCYALPSYK